MLPRPKLANIRAVRGRIYSPTFCPNFNQIQKEENFREPSKQRMVPPIFYTNTHSIDYTNIYPTDIVNKSFIADNESKEIFLTEFW